MNAFLRLIIVSLLTFSSAGQTVTPHRFLYSGAAPQAVDDAYTTDEDVTLVVPVSGSPYNGVLSNDTDVEVDTLSAFRGTGPSHGILTLSSNGSFTYIPDENWNGKDSFTYYADDGTDRSGPAMVIITILPVDDVPTASADSYSTNEDTPLVLIAPGVLENDTQVDIGETFTAVLDSNPANGTLSLHTNGSFEYTPDPDVNGPDAFTYHASDGTNDSNTVTVTINVIAINDPPAAQADSYTTPEDQPLTVPALTGVLSNDRDAEGEPLTSSADSQPEHGSLIFNNNGSFTYTPTANWYGTDAFTYHTAAGGVNSETVPVTIAVTSVNDIPTADHDSYPAVEDTVLTVPAPGVLTGDTDVESTNLTAHLDSQPVHGSVALNQNGGFIYTPEQDYNGPATFTYHARDGEDNSPSATVTLNIAAVNDAPIAENDSYMTAEDITLSVTSPGVLNNDHDVETGSTLTATLDNGPSSGALLLRPNGSFDYTPAANFYGSDSFTYIVSDGELVSDPATVTITINPVNDIPFAAADAYDATEDVPLTINAAQGLLDNDRDVENDPMTAAVATQPAHGSVVVQPDGSFTYTPEPDYNGTVTFTYTASDGGTPSQPATVTLSIAPVNDVPVGVNDSYQTNEDSPLIIAAPGVLSNDTDVDHQTLTAELENGPANGSLTLDPNGRFTYSPNENWFGTDTFTYHATDGELVSGTVTVTIDVASVNDAPATNPDSFTGTEDVTLVVPARGVLSNDADIEGDSITAVLYTQPDHGSVVLNADGSFTYTPELNINGAVTFRYRAYDGTSYSTPTTVTLNLAPVNDLPVPVNDSYTTAEDTPLNTPAPGVISNDQDVDNLPSALTATLVSIPEHGSLSFHGDGSFLYTPAENYHGPDSFTYYVSDLSGRSTGEATVSLTITSVNDAPTVTNDSYSTAEDIQLTITVATAGVLGNDNDVDGDTLRTVLVDSPANGSLVLNPNGTFIYSPAANFNGTDTFTYRASDGTAQSGQLAVVTIEVTRVNDAPVAYNAAPSTQEDTAVNLTLSASDVDGDNLIYSIFSDPSHGTLSGTLPNVTYTPALNYYGPDSFVFQVSDGNRTASATVSLTINPVNDAPVGGSDSYTTDEDKPLTVNAVEGVLRNDTDVDSASLSVAPSGGPSHGSVTLNVNGSFTYTPVLNYNGPDTFSYRVSDGAASSGVVVVTITINAVNDMPVSQGESYSINEDQPLVIGRPGLLSNDSDVDGDTLSVVNVVGPANGTVENMGNGSFRYIPSANYYGTDSFTYQVYDGTVNTTAVTTNINIASVNDAPEPVPDDYTIGREGVLTVASPGILQNDQDVEDDPITIKRIVSQPAEGTLKWNADGSFTYRTNPGSFGTVTFSYIPTDGKDEGQTATVTINLTPQSTATTVWTAPVSTGSRYKLGPETVILSTGIEYEEGFPCATGDIDCEAGLTYSVESILVRYYYYDVINGVPTPKEIGDSHTAPYNVPFDATPLRLGKLTEVDAAATITVIARDSGGQQVGSPILLTSNKQIIYLSRMVYNTANNRFIPVTQKLSAVKLFDPPEALVGKIPPGDTPWIRKTRPH